MILAKQIAEKNELKRELDEAIETMTRKKDLLSKLKNDYHRAKNPEPVVSSEKTPRPTKKLKRGKSKS